MKLSRPNLMMHIIEINIPKTHPVNCPDPNLQDKLKAIVFFLKENDTNASGTGPRLLLSTVLSATARCGVHISESPANLGFYSR